MSKLISLIIGMGLLAQSASAESCVMLNEAVTPQTIFYGMRCPIVVDGRSGYSFSGKYYRVDSVTKHIEEVKSIRSVAREESSRIKAYQ